MESLPGTQKLTLPARAENLLATLALGGIMVLPLAEIAPELRHPVLGITVREMLERLPPGETEKVWTAS